METRNTSTQVSAAMSMGVSTRTTVSAPASGMDLVDVAAEAQELKGKGHAIDDELTALAREVSVCAAA